MGQKPLGCNDFKRIYPKGPVRCTAAERQFVQTHARSCLDCGLWHALNFQRDQEAYFKLTPEERLRLETIANLDNQNRGERPPPESHN